MSLERSMHVVITIFLSMCLVIAREQFSFVSRLGMRQVWGPKDSWDGKGMCRI